MALLPPPADDLTVVRHEDLKAFFENIDEHYDTNSRNGTYHENRVILERRLRNAVGLTMPSHRFR